MDQNRNVSEGTNSKLESQGISTNNNNELQSGIINETLNLVGVANQIYYVIQSQKRIKIPDIDIRKTVQEFVSYINYFNTFDQFNKFAFKEIIPISEVIILNEFKDLIYPASIKRVAGSYLCDELLIKIDSDLYNTDDFSYLNYMNCINKLRSFTRRDAFTDNSRLIDVKLEVSLDSVISRIEFDGRVRIENNWFYPIPVNSSNDYSDIYYNTESSIAINNYFANLKIC